MSFIHWIILLFSMWRLLKATHPIVAVLTQVVASNEEGHQLPVILKIHRLFLLKRWREDQKERERENKKDAHQICGHKTTSVHALVGAPYIKLTEAFFMVSIRRRTCPGIPLCEIFSWVQFFTSAMQNAHNTWKWTNHDQRNIWTHDILAPDTAMLKPVCHFPWPFDTPLILGLNFLRISDV